MEEKKPERVIDKAPCLKILAEHDPEYERIFEQLFNTTFLPGTLDVKTKMLIPIRANASTGIGYGFS